MNLYATVAVLGMVRDKNGIIVARFSDMTSTVPWNFYRGPLPPDRVFLAQWEAAAIPSRYETQVELGAGAYKVEIVVTDGEKFGKKELNLVVDGVRPGHLGRGDILLCKRFHPVLEGAQAAEGAPKSVPLVSTGGEFNPTGDMRFASGQRLVAYFEIYGAAANNASFRLRVREAKSTSVKMDTGWQAVEARSWRPSHVMPIAAEMKIAGLAPGEYVMEVQAENTSGAETAMRSRTFEVQ